MSGIQFPTIIWSVIVVFGWAVLLYSVKLHSLPFSPFYLCLHCARNSVMKASGKFKEKFCWSDFEEYLFKKSVTMDAFLTFRIPLEVQDSHVYGLQRKESE